MCGIVGLLVRDPSLEASLGQLVTPMVSALGARGADSTGIAVYRPPDAGRCRVSVQRRHPDAPWAQVLEAFTRGKGRPLPLPPVGAPTAPPPEANALAPARAGPARGTGRAPGSAAAAPAPGSASPASAGTGDVELVSDGNTALVSSPLPLDQTLSVIGALKPAFLVAGYGHSVEVIKDIGEGTDVCARYHLSQRRGYLALGHTRMATESAVTSAHSHPFVPAPDLCVVHNGSFSNHATVRRRLEADGWSFDSDNDSEVAARYLASRLAAGDDLEQAVRWLTKELDGFFTLGITTADSLVVVRDAFACKPAVIAETDRYVAVASEYRALATLPGVEGARVFEPSPEEIYLWTR